MATVAITTAIKERMRSKLFKIQCQSASIAAHVRHLFQKLEKRDKDTEDRARKAVLKELLTFTASFATYSRAAQFIDFFEGQPDRETAIAMLVAFRIQQLISPEGKKEEFAELRRTTRNQVEKEAAVWAQTIIDSGLGKLKDGWDFNRPPDGK